MKDLIILERKIMGGVTAYMPDNGWKRRPDIKKKYINSYEIPDIFERKKLYRTLPQFRRLMSLGIFILVDGKFCLKSKKYIIYDGGLLHLTEYANEHLNECCILFTYEYSVIYNENQEERYNRICAHFIEKSK